MRAARACAWLCIAAIAILSLLPGASIQRSDLGGHAEHVLAYAGTATVFSFAYRMLGPHRTFLMLTACAACLEYLQRFSPGRTSSFFDFLYSMAGVALGVAVFLLGRSVMAAMAARTGSQVKAPAQADTRTGINR